MISLEMVLRYHEETKHHYHRFARSLGYLDWDSQPDPFRRFDGSELIPLKLVLPRSAPVYRELFQPGAISPEPVSLDSISRFFRNSLAISAWKRYREAHWSLRVNPSSGNLHPTEGYVILGDSVPEIPAGVFHYAPREHALERRAHLPPETWKRLTEDFPPDAFFTGLSSLHWREAWKYGERAFRYCQHDIGHAIASLRISAALLGWQIILLEDLSDIEVAALLGLNRAKDFDEAEDEHPDLIACVIPSRQALRPGVSISTDAISLISAADWQGRANRLSASHVEWKIIDDVAAQTRKPHTEVMTTMLSLSKSDLPRNETPDVNAEKIIQQRRSAVAMDGITSISRNTFYQMMQRVYPAPDRMPFDMYSQSRTSVPWIHLALFVNRVDELDSGLYFLIRDSSKVDLIKAAMNERFQWAVPRDCPRGLPLFCLETGDFHQHASSVSCGQDIAGDGAFSLGMIAEFLEPLQSIGPWFYRRLFWEAGLIGQILYLEAEAAGIRSTGIGCYFDDPVHGLFGFQGNRFQSLYHFTVGGPVDDTRLTTEEPYGDHVSRVFEYPHEIDQK